MSNNGTHEIRGHHKLPLIGAFGVVVATLLLVGLSMATGIGKTEAIQSAEVMHRDLLFRDTAEGHVVVLDAKTKTRIAEYGVGDGAFVRVSVRSLHQTRIKKTVDVSLPYRLILQENGGMTLADPHTKTSIALNGFGAVARRSFAPLLKTDHSAKGANE